MPSKTSTAASEAVVIEMSKDKDCKGSVRFATADVNAVVTNVYVSRAMPGASAAKAVRITIEVVS